jgi:hypothetical protein
MYGELGAMGRREQSEEETENERDHHQSAMFLYLPPIGIVPCNTLPLPLFDSFPQREIILKFA